MNSVLTTLKCPQLVGRSSSADRLNNLSPLELWSKTDWQVYMHTDRTVWFTWLTKIDFVRALPGKLGTVTLFLLFSMLQMEVQRCFVFLNKMRGCRGLHAQI